MRIEIIGPAGSGGGSGGIPTYANLAAFPAANTVATGSQAIALDTQLLYESDGVSWIVIAGPGVALSIGNFGSSPTAKGLSLSGNVLTQQPADATHPGALSTVAQTIAGDKTYQGNVYTSADATYDIGTTSARFNHVYVADNVLVGSTTAGTRTYAQLSGADVSYGSIRLGYNGQWQQLAFDGVELLGTDAVGYGTISFKNLGSPLYKFYGSANTAIFTLTDTALTLTGTAQAANIIDTGLTAGTAVYADSSKQLASSATTSTELGYVSGVTSAIQTQLNGKQATGSYVTALTGDVTASGPGSVAATLATVNSNVGSFGSSTAIPSVTVNAKGLVTAASTSAVIAPAGTLSGTTLNATVVSSSLTSVGTIATGVWQGTAVATGFGGTGVASVTTSPTASAFAGWDSSKNLSANNHLEGYQTIATAAGTTALTVSSPYNTVFTGSTTQTVTTPVVSGLALGTIYNIINNSSGVVTVQSSGANTIQAMAANTQLLLTSILNTGTNTASWNWNYGNSNAALPALNPMTTGGDVIYGGASGVPTRLANGTAGQVLVSAGGTSAPSWSPVTPIYAPMTVQVLTSGSTYNKDYTFVITSGSATVGATYTNNSVTFTVYATVASATKVVMSGSGAPTATGTLTKSGGTGDSTLTFSQVLAPLYLKVRMAGAGGGGGGSATLAGNDGGTGGTGGNTTFGTSLLTANGGTGGANGDGVGGSGGTATVASPATQILAYSGVPGGAGSSTNATVTNIRLSGGAGGGNFFAPGGPGGTAGSAGIAGLANSGAGGGGGGAPTSGNVRIGSGGGSGGYLEAIIPSPSATYSYAIGAGGSGGSAPSGSGGGGGGAGIIIVEEHYQ